MMKVKEDLTDKTFGYLTVLYQTEDKIGSTGIHYPMWMCECKCGNKIIVNGNSLKNGHTKSCGCYNIEQSKLKLSKNNKYDLTGEFGIGYTSKGEEFYFDLDDYNKIKDYCWYVNNHSYICTNIYEGDSRKTISMHNLIMDNKDENIVPDHIHGKNTRNDNRKSNLRFATYSQNRVNSGLQSNNTSGVTGVSWHKATNSWRARIHKDYKEIVLGHFDNFEDAVKARKEAEEKYFGEYSYDNSQAIKQTN